MTSLTAAWRLHSKYTMRPLRTTLCASTALFIIYLASSTGSRSTNWTFFVICAVYAGVLIAILDQYVKSKKTAKIISVNGGTLSIPRFIRNPHRIHFHEIKSLEKYGNSKGNFAVLLGRFDKSSIHIDRPGFATADDFEEFVRFVEQCASANQSAEFAERAASIAARSGATNQSATILISLTWLAIYAVVATSGIREINDSAITHGALTKDSLKIDELYRIASSFFLHLSPIHLGLNILTFAVIGRNIEIILGRVRLINTLLLSAVSGAVLSWAFSSYSAVIGASGGIFGLLGAFLLVCIRHQRSFPGSVSTSGRSISVALVLQFIFDVTTPGVDVFSHLGGFLFGLVYARPILWSRTAANFDSASPAEFRVAVSTSTLYIGGLTYFFSLYFNLL
jgi:membrane associated rhomboid family serine protease